MQSLPEDYFSLGQIPSDHDELRETALAVWNASSPSASNATSQS
jgi:hypothetical protein